MKKYASIELLRLIASLAVILYHYNLYFVGIGSVATQKLPFYKILNIFYNFGIYGVEVFFTISGFVFAHVYLGVLKRTTAKEFFINRFARLYPLHFLTLIFIIVIQYFNFIYFNENTFLFSAHNDLYHFILNLFFISGWGFQKGFSFNAPIWSVSIEIATYIFFFISLKHMQTYKIFMTMALSIIFLILSKTILQSSLFVSCTLLFFLGILVYQIINDLKFKIKNILYIISFSMVILSFLGNFKIYLFCPFLLMFVALLDDYIQNNKIRNLFRSFGNLTYSLYLIHFPTMVISILVVNKFNISHNVFNSYLFFSVFFVFLMGISFLSYNFYETFFNNLIRKRFK